MAIKTPQDFRNDLREAAPLALTRMFEMALDEKVAKTHRRTALKWLLRRNFERPVSADKDPTFQPQTMSSATRATLQAALDALK